MFSQSELYGGLTGSKAFRWQAQSAAAARQPHVQSAFIVGFEQDAAVGVHHGDGVVQHHAEHFVERQLRMEQRGGSEKLIELAETCAGACHDVGAGDVLHTRKQVWNRLITDGCGGAIDNLVGVFHSEGDDVAVLQLAAFDLLAIHEEAAALAAIFDVMFVGLHHHRVRCACELESRRVVDAFDPRLGEQATATAPALDA